uniref:Uncharacterized protein n=1 Tax=Plectus sambesii TaxID=2011161 RepID=A0A914V1U3_9BILA
IWLKDKNKKPQAKHIQSRAEYLLKYLAKHTDVNRARVRTNKSATIDGAITAVLSDAKKAPKKQLPPAKPKEKKEKERETKKREVEEGEIESEKPTKGFKRDSKPKKVEKPLFTAKTDHMVVNSKKYGSDLQSSSGKQFQEEYLADQATKSASKATLDKWHSYLWIFLSRFIEPFQEPNDLLHQYRAAVKTRNDNPDLLVESSSHHHHHHNSSKHHDKEKDKEKEREREKEKPHHSHPNTSSTSKASSSDHHRHRDRNERSSSST